MRLLHENKALFGSASLSKFWQFASKRVFWNPATFVENGRYCYDRGVERNFMEHWDGSDHGRWRWYNAVKNPPIHMPYTCHHVGVLATVELCHATSVRSEHSWPARVIEERSEFMDHEGRPWGALERESDREREIVWKMVEKRLGEGERVAEGWERGDWGGHRSSLA